MKFERTEDGNWIEKGRRHVTAHDQNGHVTAHPLPDTPLTIEQRIFVAVAQSGRAVTRTDIAKVLGLKTTGWLIAKIEGMVSDGYLNREHGRHYNGVVKYLYSIRG